MRLQHPWTLKYFTVTMKAAPHKTNGAVSVLASIYFLVVFGHRSPQFIIVL